MQLANEKWAFHLATTVLVHIWQNETLQLRQKNEIYEKNVTFVCTYSIEYWKL